MKIIKSLCLVFTIILLFVIGCSNTSYVSAPENNVYVQSLDASHFESVIKAAKDSVVLLSLHPNANPESDPKLGGLCTGVVIDDIGHVITNFHCVYKQNYIRLFYYDKNDWRERKVTVIGTDPLADLALIKVIGEDKQLPHLMFADNVKEISIGTEVFAIGHPMGMVWTVTKGIVSSNERFARHPFIKAIQTDAAINKGNSGGPLLNMKGEIIGINSLMISKSGTSAGVGLAVRGDVVKKSFESMMNNGRVDRPAIGVMIAPLSNERSRKKILKEFPDINSDYIPNTFGLLVRPTDDIPEGLEAYDLIVAVNDQITNNGLDFSDELIKHNIGDNVTLTIIRKRWYIKVDIPLKVLPIPVEKMYARKQSIPKPEKE
jgi:serine protease Do